MNTASRKWCSPVWLSAMVAMVLAGAAAETGPVATVKALKDRSQRGHLSDQRQSVRGDTGKWSDEPVLVVAPPIERKPEGLSLDNWMDHLAEKPEVSKARDDHWLLFRSRQYDDNDRVWIEKIERRGSEFTIVMNEAVWQGHYQKTFTYYEVLAVNLGKLPPGNYTVKWRVKPLEFTRFEDPGQPKDNWPRDEKAGSGETVELKAAFSVEKE